MNRRSLLGGLLAVVAAPAVITTPGLLMPVSTLALPMYGPGGILSPAMIAAEFNRCLQKMVATTIIPGTEDHKQSSVDMPVPGNDFTLSMEDFTERYIAPVTAHLAAHINERGGKLSIGRIMQPSLGADGAAMDDRNGVMARVVHKNDIWNDLKTLRLDILHS